MGAIADLFVTQCDDVIILSDFAVGSLVLPICDVSGGMVLR